MALPARAALQKRITAWAFVFISLAGLMPVMECAADSKIEIRFTAAMTAYRKNYQDNQPFDSLVESAGYDAVWKGNIIGKKIILNHPKILFGGGHTNNVYKIGGGSCSGSLSVNQDLAGFLPSYTVDANGKVTMGVPIPHAVANTTLTAFLMDKSQDEQSKCRTASAELAMATCYNPTRDCYTVEGNISPVVDVPNEDTLFQKFLNRRDTGYFQFNINSANASIPLSYTVNNKTMDSDGKVDNEYKVVWSGFVKVATSPGPDNPNPVDPFTFFDFDPGSLSGPPSDAVPPTNPYGGEDPFSATLIKLFLKQFGPVVNSFSRTIQGLNSVGGSGARLSAVVAPITGTTFDDITGAATIGTDVVGETPASGVLQVKMKVLTPDKARGVVLKIPKKAVGTQIVKGQAATVPFTLDRGSLSKIRSGKAVKVLFATRFTPSGSKKSFEKNFTFSLKKR